MRYQRNALDTIGKVVYNQSFFSGETGKTFIINLLLSKAQRQNIVRSSCCLITARMWRLGDGAEGVRQDVGWIRSY